MKNCLLVLAIIMLFGFSLVSGDELAAKKSNVGNDLSQLSFSYKTLNDLSKAIDFWHDANLKGEVQLVRKSEHRIFSLLDADIQQSVLQAVAAKSEVEKAKAGDPAQVDKSNQAKLDDNNHEYDVRTRFLKSKKYLIRSLRSSDSFSYRYRLLNDYLDLLRKEINTEKIELAEEIKETSEDR